MEVTVLNNQIEWKISNDPVEYNFAILEMNKRVLEIKKNYANEMIWLLEHNSIFTAGTSAKKEDLKNSKVNFQYTGRGGQWTWHGPGQRVVYLMINLNNRKKDIKFFVNQIEKLIIEILNNFHIVAEAIPDHHGVFVKKDNGQLYKIASIGLKVKKWVTYHGFSININPDLSHYEGIKPCGMSSKFVTSFSDLGYNIKSKEIDKTIEKTLVKYFN